MKSAEERALKRATEIAQPIMRSMWTSSRGALRDLLRDMWIEGYREGIRACIEELRSKDAFLIQIEPIGETAGAMKAETGFKWADWLEKRMKEGG